MKKATIKVKVDKLEYCKTCGVIHLYVKPADFEEKALELPDEEVFEATELPEELKTIFASVVKAQRRYEKRFHIMILDLSPIEYEELEKPSIGDELTIEIRR